ncbi:hypothetical protein TNCV_4838041 [Trichonephila clavipes]|nr:hypothetical protein TNCV_4838041 [Trichonephila clavipes]
MSSSLLDTIVLDHAPRNIENHTTGHAQPLVLHYLINHSPRLTIYLPLNGIVPEAKKEERRKRKNDADMGKRSTNPKLETKRIPLRRPPAWHVYNCRECPGHDLSSALPDLANLDKDHYFPNKTRKEMTFYVTDILIPLHDQSELPRLLALKSGLDFLRPPKPTVRPAHCLLPSSTNEETPSPKAGQSNIKRPIH